MLNQIQIPPVAGHQIDGSLRELLEYHKSEQSQSLDFLSG
jgi:hypothetical protein